ncbi:MAG: HDIG domain-containing protein [Bacteroidetes bacterium]|jgi:putative nucleotidyltransferase with HDIG domain|nr:HDIG domain-containing protein [Bacteroidota bacterium]
MKRLLQSIRENIWFVNRLALFFAALVIITYLLPRQGKFQYEYQLGMPWRHDDLIAQFDFPIHKSDAELAGERDSIMKSFRPYYNFQIEVGLEQIKNFKTTFEEEWNKFSVSAYDIENPETFKESSRYRTHRQLRDKYREFISGQLLRVYDKGILELNDNVSIDKKNGAIVIAKYNVAEEQSLAEVFTPKSAYQYISNNLSQRILEENSTLVNKYNPFFEQFSLDRFISSNLIYDQQRSENYRQAILSEISPTKDIVREGQLIIERGDVITEEQFQQIESFRKEYEQRLGESNKYYFILLGKIIIVLVSLGVLFLFLFNFRITIFRNAKHVIFILFLIVGMLGVTKASQVLEFNTGNIYWIPFTLLPIIMRTFFDARLALFTHFVTTLLIGFYAPNAFEFLFLNFIAGNVAIFTLTNSNRRRKIVVTSLFVMLAYAFTYMGFSIIRHGDFNSIDSDNFLLFGINGLFLFVAYPLIYVFEKSFGFVSDATLLELSDTNQPLLRQLAEKAPGTFQHSLQVGNIAEEAIYRIGGNALLVRTGALYHDIGKMDNPIYFIENQRPGMNPHDRIEFNESAKIIINHVKKGVEIARKNKLPEIIVDFIRTHHGTSTVQYFYRNYVSKYPDEEVSIKDFSYPGPRPHTKEMAVLMMSDSVEAASRSLKNITEESLENLVDNIINYQQVEEQYNEADITYKDISIAKEIFKKRLKEIYHARIAYPE